MSTHHLDRYVLYDKIASGGMATVHLARMRGALGFARTVAIKRLHPHLAQDPEFASMLLDEAHLAARIRHPNVVSTLDVVAQGDELFLVMEYVNGEPLSRLRGESRLPLPVASAIVCDLLLGLHAAHEALSESGKPLGIVHRDVSPQNVLVGLDGVARVADFGVAKAASRIATTRDGTVKGKLHYMAPEQIQLRAVDRRADIYAAGVVAWESFAGQRLFVADDAAAVIAAVLAGPPQSLRTTRSDVPEALASVVERALAFRPSDRFSTALEMAKEMERAMPPAPRHAVAEWLAAVGGERARSRSIRLSEIESEPMPSQPDDVSPALKELQEAKAVRSRAVSAPTIDVLGDPTLPNTTTSPALATVVTRTAGMPRRVLLATAAILAAVLATGWVAVHTWAPKAGRAPLPAASMPDGVTPPAASSSPFSTEAPVDLLASSGTSATPPPSATSDARPRPARLGQPKGASKIPSSSCTPPYYVDGDGIKRAKVGCY